MCSSGSVFSSVSADLPQPHPDSLLSWQLLEEILRLGQMRHLNAKKHTMVEENEPVLIYAFTRLLSGRVSPEYS